MADEEDEKRRFFRLYSGGVTYAVVAKDSAHAMLLVVQAEIRGGTTDERDSLNVQELTVDMAKGFLIGHDGDSGKTPLYDMPYGEVSCSEWP